MKRKRKNKKGKKKAAPAMAVTNEEATVELVNSEREDNSGADEYDDGDDNNNNHDTNNDEDADEDEENDDEDKNEEQQNDSVMEVNTPSSTGTDQPVNLTSTKPEASVDKTADKSIGRVKVKLKAPKALESQSDADKSSLQLGIEKQGVTNDKMEATGNSVSEVKAGVSGAVSKKPGSIKIKSSKVLGDSTVDKCSNTVNGQDGVLEQKEPWTPAQESQYNKQDLDSSLSVIKKVMKMDAAEPFNVPVNPEALGIPDYFDVIDTPMDFGTVCNRLEKGEKYMNSEDVYKDVQYIWENCYKYNNKGDYILDLMRRVKKNFMKYWIAAGLFTDQSRGSSGEGGQGDEGGVSSQGQGKSSQSKQKKKKGHGRRHKSDCLCAICVLKRRRREREESARLAKGQIGVTDGKLAQEGSLHVESPGGEDSISNMDESLDQEADAEVEGMQIKLEETEQQYRSGTEKPEDLDEDDDEDEEEDNEMEIDIQNKGKAETSENADSANKSGKHIQQTQHGLTEDSQKGHVIGQHENEAAEIQHNIQKENEERQKKKAKMYEKFRPENPLLLNLCQTLFPSNRRSLWSGPQSIFQHQGSVQTSSIHATIDTLMK